MPYLRDLGFPSAAPVVLLLFVPLFALLVRRRWRIAAARREEVRRLLRLAEEETARVEIEYALAYCSGPSPVPVAREGSGRPQCAVCFSPTTTRCSRCKAVRYCSGKCQIIHWRLGHKDECHPPRIDDHCNGTRSVFDLKGVRIEQSDLCDNGLEIERKPHADQVERFSEGPSSESNFSSEVFSEDDNPEIKPFVDTSLTDHTSDSSCDSSSSSSCFSFSGPVETSVHASAGEDRRLFHNANMGESFSDVFPDRPRTKVDASETNPTKVLHSEFTTTGLSANDLSCTSNFKPKASSPKPGEVDCRSSGQFGSSRVSDICMNAEPSEGIGESDDSHFDSRDAPSAGVIDSSYSQFREEGDHMMLDAMYPLQVSSKLPRQFMSSQPTSADEISSYKAAPTEVTSQLDIRDSTVSAFDKSGFVPSGRSNDVLLPKSRGLSSLHASYSGGGHSVSSDTSLNMDNAPKVGAKFSDGTNSVSNDMCDLKTSVRRVVQQFKPSQILRHCPSAPRSDIYGKYKVLFPYDLFIKLYNCDKVELRPCGLFNCGNSCYANAVLQCLAFTRPLTAFLLQGLHTKTCLQRESCFTCEFESLLMKVKEGQSPLSPIGILSQINKIGSPLAYGREEDAHEFLRYVIDAMQSVCLKEARANAVAPLAEETTLIQLIFGGYLLSKIKCMRCRGKSEQRERMMDLTVEINGDIGTLEEALARFTATEVLDGENKYQCNRCKSYERAKKKLTVLEAPNVLTVALKRFQSGKFGKLNKAVRFPEYLDLAPYMSGTDDKSPVYRLYAVVVHLDIMNAAFSGHYVCYVKSRQKWYKIDDCKVKPVELERVLSKNAYMLLYARCSPRAPSVIRIGMSQEPVKNKSSRCKEGKMRPPDPRLGSSPAHNRSQVRPHWSTDHRAGFQPSDLFDERFQSRRADSTSGDSSCFGSSDAASCSTESTRNSTSTDDYSEYIFGDSGRLSWNSSYGFSEDSDGLAQSPLSSRHASDAVLNPTSRASDFSYAGREDAVRTKGSSEGYGRPRGSKEGRCFEGRGSPPILCFDTADECRKLTEQCRGSSIEANCVKSYEAKSSVLLRRPTTRDRTTQTFY